jgi:hypothetical protein
LLDIVRLRLSSPNSDENPKSIKGLDGAWVLSNNAPVVVVSVNMKADAAPPYITKSEGLELGLKKSEFISIIKGSEYAMAASELKIGTSRLDKRCRFAGSTCAGMGDEYVEKSPVFAIIGTVMVGVVSGD